MSTLLVLFAIIAPGKAPQTCAAPFVEITIPQGAFVMLSAVVAVETPLVEGLAVGARSTRYADPLFAVVIEEKASVQAPADR